MYRATSNADLDPPNLTNPLQNFAYGFLDASWGLFRDPVMGAVKGGPLGLVTGFGKAGFGLIARPGSGQSSSPGSP
jgi:hypothetical protein